ncbi:hypothetical protein IWQ62_003069 [Dispira parvispora]|uniref:MYND-type domain-containing protein n=1 Tax=Dispira parvispora TaxID=1520584 RepID=A0A9W8ASJ0_9FUNG|nr:hypothetical protein IWQ62_003069 [Dispira parvispora]
MVESSTDEHRSPSDLVQLGFAERPDEWFFNDVFPSKIGGKPVWLNPDNPLKAEEVLCGECGKPMPLLLQLYTPEDKPKEAFHRMLFKVYRSQMPENNPYYTAERIETDPEDNSSDVDILEIAEDEIRWERNPNVSGATLCVVCGLHGSKACSRCKVAHYCSREHQIVDWTVGEHRQRCKTLETSVDKSLVATSKAISKVLFPLSEILSEPEEASNSTDKEYEKYLSRAEMSHEPNSHEDLEDSESTVDKTFLEFQHRVAWYPQQVLRYARTEYDRTETQPLYVSDQDKPTDQDISTCTNCGTARQFELQILPQLLNHLGVDHSIPGALDWGSLFIYSCPDNCVGEDPSSEGDIATRQPYLAETLWRQNFSSDGMEQKLLSHRK